MRAVVTVAEMRALDRATIEDIGIPGLTLMETAGRAVSGIAGEMLAENPGHVAVVCGPGNNGGDGFVAARVLRFLGWDAVVYLAVPRSSVKGDAATHLAILERSGGVVRMIDTPQALDEVGQEIAGAALAIDALFGVGLTRPIEGHLADVVATINDAAQRLAVDVPSGLDADTGAVLGACVVADKTVTIAVNKVAHVSAPGFAYCGEIVVADIGVPNGLLTTQGVRAAVVERVDVEGWLPYAELLDHKGKRGHVVIIGGMPGMRGAGRLSANAALRTGAGLVTLASADEPTADDSVMTATITGGVRQLVAAKQAIVIGPGLGQSTQAAGWLGEVLASGIPAVLDADALNLATGIVETLRQSAGPLVLTPHPGEAARLLGTTAAAIEADRLAAARALAAKAHAIIVLKGARTIVCDGTIDDDFCWINTTGGPELATAGSGDVLAGVIAALIAQGVPAADAARAGVYVHGRAGEQLATTYGLRGVVSSDLPAAIAGVIREICDATGA